MTQVPDSSQPPASAWVDLLRQYGPVPQSGALFDEFTQQLAARAGVAPIRFESAYLQSVVDKLTAQPPVSVIVTGTAGDGKTFHLREAWMRLGGSDTEWRKKEKVKTLSLGGRSLHVVRDLSEFANHERDELLPNLAADLVDPDPKRVYLIAANDGRLLSLLQAPPRTTGLDLLHRTIEEELLNGRPHEPAVRVGLVNLSRQAAGLMLPLVLGAITKHKEWDKCQACPLRSPGDGVGCSIWENRRRLAGAEDNGVFQRRLGQLAALAERNSTHFTVRELLQLVTNVLLGHPDAEHGLLRCRDIGRVRGGGEASVVSPFGNVFGENLTERRRRKLKVFDALGRFGIGSETNNRIDGLLVYGADDNSVTETFDKLVRSDPVYGASPAFLALQRAYLEGGAVRDGGEFITALRAQRQRLFFTIVDADIDRYGLWNLSVFQFAGEYLKLIAALQQGGQASSATLHRLARGLNRVFTGALLRNHDRLYLASSGSYAQAKRSVLLEHEITNRPEVNEGLSVRFDNDRDLPVLSVGLGWRMVDEQASRLPPEDFELSLLRFEFLSRVAEGALPTSFSLECYEDALAFKARIVRVAEGHVPKSVIGATLRFRFLGVASDGMARTDEVEVKLL